LLLNKLLKSFIVIIILIFLTVSCKSKEDKLPVINYQNKTQLLEIVKKHFDQNTNVAFGGDFDGNGRQSIVVGWEIENDKEWGIKFAQLERIDNELKEKFGTQLLQGSFKQSFIDKIKFASFENELIYYNSGDYFLGSGGGEIYSYIIDFVSKQVYEAHLVIEPRDAVNLFISKNTDNREIKNFFILTLRKDYPTLKVVDEDITVD
jgi:pimeloyl-CoA synthetase